MEEKEPLDEVRRESWVGEKLIDRTVIEIMKGKTIRRYKAVNNFKGIKRENTHLAIKILETLREGLEEVGATLQWVVKVNVKQVHIHKDKIIYKNTKWVKIF